MTAPAIELMNISKRFRSVVAVDDVSFRLPKGGICGLIGPNGAGKTTLLNIIAGVAAPDRGSVRLLGRDVTRAPADKRARCGLGRSFQITSVFPTLSVRQNVRCALLGVNGYGQDIFRDVARDRKLRKSEDSILEHVGLRALADVRAGELSYGAQRALDLAMAIAPGNPMLLLDEPTAGMSSDETRSVVELIRSISPGRTVLLIEHDMSVVFSLCTRIIVMAGGRVIADGAPDAVSADAKVREAYFANEQPCLN